MAIEGDGRHAAETRPRDDDLTPGRTADRRETADRRRGGRRIRQAGEKQECDDDRSADPRSCVAVGKIHFFYAPLNVLVRVPPQELFNLMADVARRQTSPLAKTVRIALARYLPMRSATRTR